MKVRIQGWRRLRLPAQIGIVTTVLLCGSIGTYAIITNLTLVGQLHSPQAEHADQAEFLALVQAGENEQAFEDAFEDGDELFEAVFNALDGSGANVGNGERFTRVPRADLTGAGQWKTHTPARATGPNGQTCVECHQEPGDGSGPIAANVHRDPTQSANLKKFIQRNTPHLFAPGAIQVAAEEMTKEIQSDRDIAIALACASIILGIPVTKDLDAKGVNFGKVTAKRTSGGTTCPPPFTSRKFTLDVSQVKGVSTDLVVRPFQWKGSVAFIRDFNRGASMNELGMQAVEIVGDDIDGDFDGVKNEMTIGDQTALAVYIAGQPRPTTRTELSDLGLLDPPVTQAERDAVNNGANKFQQIGCEGCHKVVLVLDDPIFSEPSQNPNYRDATFPAGQNPIQRGVDPAFPITFDLTKDQPDNIILNPDGTIRARLGSLRTFFGKALVELLGDLKRHDLGAGIAEQIDEVGTGASVFLTENLWGVGSTAPYMHDGRSTTLTEAILEHGGEAATARTNFQNLSTQNQKDVLAYLNNQVLFFQE